MCDNTLTDTSDDTPRTTPRPSRSKRRFLRAVSALRRALATRSAPRPPARDIHDQLAAIERDLQEMRTRVNALFFTVLTAALGQLVAGLFA